METDSKPLIPKRKEMSSGKILAVDQIIVVWYFETTRLIQWRLSSHQPDQNSHSTVEHQDGKKKTEKSPDWEGSEGSIGFSQSAGQKPLRKSLINDASRPPITNPIHQEKKGKGKTTRINGEIRDRSAKDCQSRHESSAPEETALVRGGGGRRDGESGVLAHLYRWQAR
jgi:hypothetical protein